MSTFLQGSGLGVLRFGLFLHVRCPGEDKVVFKYLPVNLRVAIHDGSHCLVFIVTAKGDEVIPARLLCHFLLLLSCGACVEALSRFEDRPFFVDLVSLGGGLCAYQFRSQENNLRCENSHVVKTGDGDHFPIRSASVAIQFGAGRVSH